MKRLILIMILFLGTFTMANTQKNYKIQFYINYMHCSFYINDVFLYTTENKYDIPTNITFGHTVGESLMNGINTISIMAIDLSPAIDIPSDVEKTCRITLNEITPDFELKEVVSLESSYDQEGKLTFKQSKVYDDNSIENIVSSVMPTLSVSSPKGQVDLPQLKGTRSFVIDYPSQFSWTKAQPFIDTPENRQKLWEKYNQLRTAIQKQNMKEIRKLLEPGISEKAAYEGLSVSRHFETTADMLLTTYFGLKPEYWDQPKIEDYELRLYAGGRLFQLVEKSFLSGSPISISKPRSTALNPVFTYIDGEIVVAWF